LNAGLGAVDVGLEAFSGKLTPRPPLLKREGEAEWHAETGEDIEGMMNRSAEAS
jgi:hypothetical protein